MVLLGDEFGDGCGQNFYASCVQVCMRHVSCFCLVGGVVVGCIYVSCVSSIFMPLCNYFYAILIV
jgi:hypothetical protein